MGPYALHIWRWICDLYLNGCVAGIQECGPLGAGWHRVDTTLTVSQPSAFYSPLLTWEGGAVVGPCFRCRNWRGGSLWEDWPNLKASAGEHQDWAWWPFQSKSSAMWTSWDWWQRLWASKFKSHLNCRADCFSCKPSRFGGFFAKVCACSLSATPGAGAPQAPLSVDSPGKNPGVGCRSLLQGIFPHPGIKPALQADSLPLSQYPNTVSAWAQCINL